MVTMTTAQQILKKHQLSHPVHSPLAPSTDYNLISDLGYIVFIKKIKINLSNLAPALDLPEKHNSCLKRCFVALKQMK